MNYQKIYDSLIQKRLTHTLCEHDYRERHRILPGCLGGQYIDANTVYLTAREHFIAHWLLYKIYRTNKLAFAWFSMCRKSPGQKRTVTSRKYEYAKQAISTAQKGKVGTFKGKKHKPESIQKMKTHVKTNEHRQKIRCTLTTLTSEQQDYLLKHYTGSRGEKAELARKWGCSIDVITRWVGKSFTHKGKING